MKVSNLLVVISLTITSYVMIIGISPDLNDFQVWLPFLLCLLYVILIFLYQYVYKRRLNQKLSNQNTKKIPELRIVSNISTITFMVLIVIYASWFALPILLYPEEEYEITLSSDIEEINFENLINDIFELVDADSNEMFIDEYFSYSVDKNKKMSRLHFSFDIERDGERIHFESDYNEGILYISHTKNMSNYSYSYKGEFISGEDFSFYEEIDYDNLLNYYQLKDNEFIVIYGSSGYADSDEYLVTPSLDVNVQLNSINGSEDFITEQTIYDDRDFFFILTREMETVSEYGHANTDQKFIIVIEK